MLMQGLCWMASERSIGVASPGSQQAGIALLTFRLTFHTFPGIVYTVVVMKSGVTRYTVERMGRSLHVNRQIQALINRPLVAASIAVAAVQLVASFEAAQFAVPAAREFAICQ